MKLTGFLLLLSGWGLVRAALILLRADPARAGFVLAGLAVEILGIVLVVRAHVRSREERA
jgi:hypothetical protein